MTPTRREFTAGALSLAAATSIGDVAMASSPVPNLILRNGRITTLDRARPAATALAVRDGRIEAVGSDNEITKLAGAGTRVVDLAGHRLIPGLNDSHTHLIRGGLNYLLELRWDGVSSLADAMAMLRAQVARTPAPHWIRVVGGFSQHQFREKRLPSPRRTRLFSSCTSMIEPCSIGQRFELWATPKTRPSRRAAASSATRAASRPGCSWPSPTP
jgi:hypothetical protein